MRRQKRQPRKISTFIQVRSEDCRDNPDIMVRKFTKKVRKSGIMDEFKDRQYYKKPSAIKSEQKRRRQKLINKLNQKQEELYNYSSLSKKRYNRRKNS
jgi:ribosomal protein S21